VPKIQRAWSTQDEAALAVLAFLGVEQVAVVLDRTPSCVRKKANRLGIPVKRICGTTVLNLSTAAVERLRSTWLLCPRCGKRLAVERLGGVCGVCHKDDLTAAHLAKLAEVQAEREAQRRLWAARQQLTRARRRLAKETGGDAASV
jgi:ribosomal protein L37AE/L43A